jgi:hypothetical protein
MILTGEGIVEPWWNYTNGGKEVWSVGGMILTGEQMCGALVELY